MRDHTRLVRVLLIGPFAFAAAANIQIESTNMRVEFDSLLTAGLSLSLPARRRRWATSHRRSSSLPEARPFGTSHKPVTSRRMSATNEGADGGFPHWHRGRTAEDRRCYDLRRDSTNGLLSGSLHEQGT